MQAESLLHCAASQPEVYKDGHSSIAHVMNESGYETRFQRSECFLALWTQGVAP